MRDRLIELIDDFVHNIDVTEWYSEEHDEGLADYLLANGVIVPPCKVGDMMYFDGKNFASHCAGEIMERRVDTVLTEAWATFRGEVDVSFDFNDFGKTVFLTRKEAEAKLKGEQ